MWEKIWIGSIYIFVVLVVVVVGYCFEKSLPQASLTPIDFLVRFSVNVYDRVRVLDLDLDVYGL